MAQEIETRLGPLRRKRGLAAAQLAKAAGVSRQTIYAIEAGSYVPNTTVALKLAQVLEVKVEELFALASAVPAPELRTERVELLPGSGHPAAGQPVELCKVGARLMASAPAPFPWYLPASDGVMAGRAMAQVFHPEEDFVRRLLVAGCDPAISVLARHARSAGVELVLAHRNSSQSLELLKQGAIHIAGTHLRDEPSGESNLPEVARLFPGRAVAVVAFAVWQEGIVTAHGNPKSVRGVDDLARPDIAIVNREPGSGSRRLLDSSLAKAHIPPASVRGYAACAPGHLAAAWQVQTGTADACIATRTAARHFGLGFIPLASERYDLVIRRAHLHLPAIQALFDVLGRSGFRRELETLGGYDARAAGSRML